MSVYLAHITINIQKNKWTILESCAQSAEADSSRRLVRYNYLKVINVNLAKYRYLRKKRNVYLKYLVKYCFDFFYVYITHT